MRRLQVALVFTFGLLACGNADDSNSVGSGSGGDGAASSTAGAGAATASGGGVVGVGTGGAGNVGVGGVGTGGIVAMGGVGTGGTSAGATAGTDGIAGAAGTLITGGAGGTVSTDIEALLSLTSCSALIPEIFSKTAIDPPATGSGIYNAAEASSRDELDRSIRLLVAGDLTGSSSAAQTAGYDICRTEEGGSLVVVWRPSTPGQGHAVIAWRAESARPLIVEAPHAFHDVDTELEAVEMFSAVRARALVVSGIYRCSSLNASGCDGVTTACIGVPIPYTISDAAHNVEMFFQAAHIALSEVFSGDAVTSLHGFGYDGISVSNGTDESPAAGSFYVRLVEELTVGLPSENITTCQQYDGATYDNRMCGSENVQGRHVNGSPEACGTSATFTSNRFVHVEQSLAVRDQQRALVIAAFDRALQSFEGVELQVDLDARVVAREAPSKLRILREADPVGVDHQVPDGRTRSNWELNSIAHVLDTIRATEATQPVDARAAVEVTYRVNGRTPERWRSQ